MSINEKMSVEDSPGHICVEGCNSTTGEHKSIGHIDLKCLCGHPIHPIKLCSHKVRDTWDEGPVYCDCPRGTD